MKVGLCLICCTTHHRQYYKIELHGSKGDFALNFEPFLQERPRNVDGNPRNRGDSKNTPSFPVTNGVPGYVAEKILTGVNVAFRYRCQGQILVQSPHATRRTVFYGYISSRI